MKIIKGYYKSNLKNIFIRTSVHPEELYQPECIDTLYKMDNISFRQFSDGTGYYDDW